MRFALLFLSLWLISAFFLPLVAQKKHHRDSLLEVVKSNVPRDSSFVKSLVELSKDYRLVFPDSAILFSKEALFLARKISYEKGIAISLNFLGIAYFYKGDYPAAQEYQKEALAYSQARNLNGPYASALNSLALAYQYQGNYFSAYDSYLKALQFEEKAKNYFGQVKVLANIGILWKKQGNYDYAIDYDKRALALIDSLDDGRAAKANIYNNMGTVFIEQKKYPEALDHFQKSMALNEELGNKLFVTTCLGNIGLCYLRIGELKKATDYLERGLAQAISSNDYQAQELTMLNLAETYLAQHQTEKALLLSKRSLEISNKYNSKDNIFLNQQILAKAYKAMGQHAIAYDYLEKAMTLGDSLKNADLTKGIRDLQKSYELNKKESEIILLEKDAALKMALLKQEQHLRYGLLGLVAVLVLITAVVYYSFSSKAALNKKIQRQNEELLKAQALRAQMNPHFIFNSLNSIQFLIMKVESAKAYDYLAKFGLLLRKVMDHSEKDFITLTEEIEIIKLYLDLESLRFEDSFDYAIEVNIPNPQSFKVPPMIVQPYIENAIQHGLMPKQGDRKLRVAFTHQAGALLCEIEDNGIGRAEAIEISKRKNRVFASKGMKYTNDRLQAMNKVLNGKSYVGVFDLHSEGKSLGTLVKILFTYA
jgi:tetratricopeptide (TPR) repeat protein